VELAPNLYAVDFGGRVRAYLYRAGGAFTLIDTGIAGRASLILAEVKRAGASPSDITRIAAHCHRDHTGNLAELRRLTGARTFAGRDDAPFIRGEAVAPEPQLTEAEQAIAETLAGGMPEAPPCDVDTELDDGDQIDLGSTPASVIHLPGHTRGSIAVYVPAARILFTGDAIASLGGGRLIVGQFNIDPALALASLERLAGLEVDVVCLGHGNPLRSRASQTLQAFLDGIKNP
jgi:glyoxylase-like metal-dependent hydrolase (beta-lactamase superfamily II)